MALGLGRALAGRRDSDLRVVLAADSSSRQASVVEAAGEFEQRVTFMDVPYPGGRGLNQVTAAAPVPRSSRGSSAS